MTKKKIEIEVDTIGLSGCTGKDIIEQIQNLEPRIYLQKTRWSIFSRTYKTL